MGHARGEEMTSHTEVSAEPDFVSTSKFVEISLPSLSLRCYRRVTRQSVLLSRQRERLPVVTLTSVMVCSCRITGGNGACRVKWSYIDGLHKARQISVNYKV